jgi:aldehyde:ferredoxin oxidoreductase
MTNGATSTQANGFLGAYLKSCGYDGVIIKGTSEKWVYLHISEETAEICEGSYLAGKGTYQTEVLIKEELGQREREMSVAAIGRVRSNVAAMALPNVAARANIGLCCKLLVRSQKHTVRIFPKIYKALACYKVS